MSPIEALAMESQDQHRRYYELFGQNPVRGDGLRDIANLSRTVAAEIRQVREQVIALNFSTAVLG